MWLTGKVRNGLACLPAGSVRFIWPIRFGGNIRRRGFWDLAISSGRVERDVQIAGKFHRVGRDDSHILRDSRCNTVSDALSTYLASEIGVIQFLAVALNVFRVPIHRVLGLDDRCFHIAKSPRGVVSRAGIGLVLVDDRTGLIERRLRA
jgi:hypothetical protein